MARESAVSLAYGIRSLDVQVFNRVFFFLICACNIGSHDTRVCSGSLNAFLNVKCETAASTICSTSWRDIGFLWFCPQSVGVILVLVTPESVAGSRMFIAL